MGRTAPTHPSTGRPAPGLRRRLVALYAGLGLASLLAWAAAAWTFHGHPVLLGTSLLAYTFGLRHAVDADHIAAIDNVTRKLMRDGRRPVAVGLFFALGHSTVVALACAGLAASAAVLDGRFARARAIGGLVGATASAGFLLLIAAANAHVLLGLVRRARRARDGGPHPGEDLDPPPAGGGPLSRLLRPLYAMIGRSWHMYPLGLLFALGFDTATEIGVLGLSAAGAARGLPVWSIMIFPALFTAGMTLVDTTDGVLMLGAYGWAFATPTRGLSYDIAVTAVSVLVAVVVGGVEALGLLGDRFGLKDGAWAVIAALNGASGALGAGIVAVFGLGWAASAALHRLKATGRPGGRSLARDDDRGTIA